LAESLDFDLDRRHKTRSYRVGHPGIEPETYGLKARSSGSLSLLPAPMPLYPPPEELLSRVSQHRHRQIHWQPADGGRLGRGSAFRPVPDEQAVPVTFCHEAQCSSVLARPGRCSPSVTASHRPACRIRAEGPIPVSVLEIRSRRSPSLVVSGQLVALWPGDHNRRPVDGTDRDIGPAPSGGPRR
jgi:hypothetical protein